MSMTLSSSSSMDSERMRRRHVPLALIGLLLLVPGTVWTQDRSATISGKVQDGSVAKLGFPRQIANAKITISDTKTKEAFLATTNNSGEYSVSKLPLSGTYKVSAEFQGFSPVVYRDVQVGPSGNIRLDFELRLGAVSPPEEVVVGSIGGVVRDQAGFALPGARITISDERSLRQVSHTNGLGEYNIHSLDSGTVRVRADRRGYRTFEYNAVPLGSPGRILRDFTLVLDTSQPADATALTFSRRLAETRDFSVLIQEFSAPAFDDYLAEQLRSPDGILRLKGENDEITIGPGFFGLGSSQIDPSVVRELNRSEIRSYFAQSANFAYLTALRLFTSLPVAIFYDEEQLAKQPTFPTFNAMFPEAAPLLRDDPVFSVWTNPPGESGVRISSAAQFRRTLSTLERAVPLMRAKVSNPPAERSEQYGSLVNLMETLMYNEGVRGKEIVCTSCVPAGTRFVQVSHGLFNFYLIDVNGQLRVAAVDFVFLGEGLLKALQQR